MPILAPCFAELVYFCSHGSLPLPACTALQSVLPSGLTFLVNCHIQVIRPERAAVSLSAGQGPYGLFPFYRSIPLSYSSPELFGCSARKGSAPDRRGRAAGCREGSVMVSPRVPTTITRQLPHHVIVAVDSFPGDHHISPRRSRVLHGHLDIHFSDHNPVKPAFFPVCGETPHH